MPEVELNVKNYRRLLSIMSEYMGKKKLKPIDAKLKGKLEVLLEAEIELDKELDNLLNNKDEDDD